MVSMYHLRQHVEKPTRSRSMGSLTVLSSSLIISRLPIYFVRVSNSIESLSSHLIGLSTNRECEINGKTKRDHQSSLTGFVSTSCQQNKQFQQV